MIPVVYEDEEILVLDKPPNLVTTSSETSSEKTLQDILASDFNIKITRAGIVHRLDKDTSGLLVVAKTLKSLESLQIQFKNREVKKEYLALVHGFLEKSGRIETQIMRNPGNREKFLALNLQGDALEAREAVTEYNPLENYQLLNSNFKSIFNDFNKIQLRKMEKMHYGEFTLIRCCPLTGRTHQIRVHLKYLSFPIVGDSKYGGRKTVRLDHRWCPRQFLHAAKLEFNHPVIGERMRLESKLPRDLKKALENLEEI